MYPTWQLLPSKFYKRLISSFFLFILLELVTYWYYGYDWQVLLFFFVLVFFVHKALQNRVLSLQYMAGQWVIETLGKKLYVKSIQVCWLSSPAMVLLLKCHHFPHRNIILLFSDQFQGDSEHLLRWYLLVKNASYHA